MAQTGSSVGMVTQSLTATVDPQGNPVISSDTAFGSSPAGVALLGQQLFGLPNGTFNLTPPNVYGALSQDNQLPYWDWIEYSDAVMTATPIYDTTAQTWGVIINPGTAASGDYCLFTTRSYLVNDDNLSLRQKAFAVIAKSGTAAATTEWNLTLSAIYYDTTNNPIGTATIGTALDTGTWSSISGYTTTGGTAIPASARFVELQFKLIATAAITGTAKVTIKSCLLSSKIGANSSFIVTETFKSSTTWTVPTGVTSLVAVAGVGAGGGGAGGCLAYGGATVYVSGAGGGGGASWGILNNVSLGTATSLSIGIGAGGAGGTAAVGTAGATQQKFGGAGAAGGATTIGSILTWSGGGGGTAGTTIISAGGGGGAIGTVSGGYYGIGTAAGTVGAAGGSAFNALNGASAGSAGNSVATANQVIYPFTTFTSLGSNSGSASNAGWGSGANARSAVGAIGTAGTVAFYGAGGGGGGGAWAKGYAAGSIFETAGGAGASYGSSGAGGPSLAGGINASTMGTTLGGNGGAAGANTGSGGGGGGAVAVMVGASGVLVAGTAGAGGAGASGYVVIAYIA